MVETAAGESETRQDIVGLEIRHFLKDLLRRESSGQEIEDVRHADPHSADTGAAAALLGVDRNALGNVSHVRLTLAQDVLAWRTARLALLCHPFRVTCSVQ